MSEPGRELRWDRAQVETAHELGHELGEDWWREMESHWIGADPVPGDVAALDVRSRVLTYVHARQDTP
jgi:hypothetical protein